MPGGHSFGVRWPFQTKPEPVAEASEESLEAIGTNPEALSAIFGITGTAPERIASVYACANVIASAVAAMPLHLYRKQGTTRKIDTDHPLARFIADRPNEVMPWKALREMTLYSLVLKGRYYWQIFTQGGYVREVFPIHPDNVTFTIRGRKPIYQFASTPEGVNGGTYGRDTIAHFRNLCGPDGQGISPLSHCRATLNSAGYLQAYGEKSASKGQPLSGIVTGAPPSKNAKVAADRRKNWRSAIREAQSEGDRVVIIEGERMQFHGVSMSMRDAQFIEQMQFSVVEIARIFNVPPHKIQELSRATYSNIEHQSIEFYTGTLVPWIQRIEEVLNDSLLTRADRAAGYYFKHNPDGLLRGDIKTRMEANSAGIMSGQITPNEARSLEEREPMEGGDRLLVGVNQTPLETLGQSPPEPTP